MLRVRGMRLREGGELPVVTQQVGEPGFKA